MISNISNIIQRATDFGTLSSRHNFFSFILKILFYIVPAAILGNYTDLIVKTLKNDQVLGDNILYYIMLQTVLIVLTMYIIILYLSDYIREFHITIAGTYFIVLYFGIQTNYIKMIKEYMNLTIDFS